MYSTVVSRMRILQDARFIFVYRMPGLYLSTGCQVYICAQDARFICLQDDMFIFVYRMPCLYLSTECQVYICLQDARFIFVYRMPGSYLSTGCQVYICLQDARFILIYQYLKSSMLRLVVIEHCTLRTRKLWNDCRPW